MVEGQAATGSPLSLQCSLALTSPGRRHDNAVCSLSAVCTPAGAGVQCRCEEGFAWPNQSCQAYGACDVIAQGVCTCINGNPPDGQSCQPIECELPPPASPPPLRTLPVYNNDNASCH